MNFIFFNDTATTEIYTLSLHDALPIFFAVFGSDGMSGRAFARSSHSTSEVDAGQRAETRVAGSAVRASARSTPNSSRARRSADRKSTRLNSSHANISYAVFCLK